MDGVNFEMIEAARLQDWLSDIRKDLIDVQTTADGTSYSVRNRTAPLLKRNKDLIDQREQVTRQNWLRIGSRTSLKRVTTTHQSTARLGYGWRP
jgi:hypothetical protein